MNRLQSLTLVRDAVALTKGVNRGLWWAGPDEHCTIGSITQVAVDCGFPALLAAQMMEAAKREMGFDLEKAIVDKTDGAKLKDMNPRQRRDAMLRWLNDQIAIETEKLPPIPSDTKGLTDALAPQEKAPPAQEDAQEKVLALTPAGCGRRS